MTKKDDDSAKKAKAALARAEKLSPAERKAIAAKAAGARWGLKATHKGNFKEEFGIDVDCYVLDDDQKTAVISQRGMAAAIGMGQIGGRLPAFIKGRKIAPYIERDLAEKLAEPLLFRWVGSNAKGGAENAHGYDVTILIDLCKAIIKADDAGVLVERQKHIVKQARVIINASAKAGIKGLVYALAGYDASREEIIAAFKVFVREEAREYEKEFPDLLYAEWYRLYEIAKPEKNKPWKFMRLTIDHVYTPLARSSGKVLQLTRNARFANGVPSKKLHQFLSEVGVKALRMHLGRLLGIAELSQNRAQYEHHVEKIFGAQLQLFPD